MPPACARSLAGEEGSKDKENICEPASRGYDADASDGERETPEQDWQREQERCTFMLAFQAGRFPRYQGTGREPAENPQLDDALKRAEAFVAHRSHALRTPDSEDSQSKPSLWVYPPTGNFTCIASKAAKSRLERAALREHARASILRAPSPDCWKSSTWSPRDLAASLGGAAAQAEAKQPPPQLAPPRVT